MAEEHSGPRLLFDFFIHEAENITTELTGFSSSTESCLRHF